MACVFSCVCVTILWKETQLKQWLPFGKQPWVAGGTVFNDNETKKILFKEVESLKNQILMTSSIENAADFDNIEVFYLSR